MIPPEGLCWSIFTQIKPCGLLGFQTNAELLDEFLKYDEKLVRFM